MGHDSYSRSDAGLVRSHVIAAAARCLIVLIALTSVVRVQAAEQSPPASAAKPSTPPKPTAIPVPEIAVRAAEAQATLRGYEAFQSAGPTIATIDKELPEIGALIEQDVRQTIGLLREQPTLETLEAEQEIWGSRKVVATTWLSALTQRATRIHEALANLAELERTWTASQESAVAARAPAPTLAQIAGVLAGIETTRNSLQPLLAATLELQGRASELSARCESVLTEINRAQGQTVRGLLRRDAPPIWTAEFWRRTGAAGFHRVRDAAIAWYEEFGRYLDNPASGLKVHVVAFLLLSVLLWAARQWTHRSIAAGEGASLATAVFDRPLSAALLLSLVSHPFLFAPAPPAIRQVLEVLVLIPVVRLTQPTIEARLVPGLYILAGLFTLDAIRRAAGTLAIEPVILSIEMLVGIVALGYMLTASETRHAREGAPVSERLHALRVLAVIVLVVFAVGLGAAVAGYLRLARLLASGVFGSAFLALLLRPVVRVLTGLAALLLRVWPISLLGMVQRHRDLLERRTRLVLICLAFVLWLQRSLDYVGLLGPAQTFGRGLLQSKVERGALSISVEDVLAFLITLWLAYLVSTFIRFALEEDVYPRVGLSRGLSYALSSLLNYVLLTLGFLAGLAVLGLDLTKVTILASAFGVGIGFGLQSIVNNFVSGLILLFERPIHLGDTVETGGISGTVRRIGIRSSVVRTGQGAEIIVPNAQLVTERVTNWTLSDRQRRIELPVGVSYSADPKKVIEMLEGVARAHPLILSQPGPKAFFMGFGDSSLNFELRAWTDQFDQWGQIRSELATAVFDAGQAAGIAFPFPQREVRLL